nr:MAG TPA: hypothetical protein [Caudoviricetes sp.]
MFIECFHICGGGVKKSEEKMPRIAPGIKNYGIM